MHGAGIELAAISYDSPEILAAFAEERGISFPLLSDPGSHTIDAYGVRNRNADAGRTRGIPHPGTVLIDSEGIIRGKLFYAGYKVRHDPQQIMALAARLDRPEATRDSKPPDTGNGHRGARP